MHRLNKLASIVAYVLIALVGALLAVAVRSHTEFALEQAKYNYRFESYEEAHQTVEKINHIFQQMYQGVRTIARLPGVRSIDRYAENFSADSQTTVQEIYNNLYSNVAVSELYIVPVDLEPDQIDLNTGKPQAPITTFDEFIVGKNADQNTDHESEEDEELEEIEIYEYRLMKQQLAWMRERFPDESYIEGLDFPAISGPMVVTCDNTYYSPSNPDERDRSGLVYSVPFYGPDGVLKGCISAVVLISVMRDGLPGDEFVIRHKDHGILLDPTPQGRWSKSRKHVDEVEPDPSLIYSSVLSINAVEGIGQWMLWVGFDNDRFWNRPDVRAALRSEFVGYLITVLVTIGMSAIAWLALRHYRTVRTFVDRLEQQVAERTSELKQQTIQLQAEITERKQAQAESERLHQELIKISRQAGKAEVATGVLHNVGNSLNSVNTAANEAARQVRELPLQDLIDVSQLIDQHTNDLSAFVVEDERGKLLPDFLRQFSAHLVQEQTHVLGELEALQKYLDHIKQVVNMQQKHARTSEVIESVGLIDIIEEALGISANSLERHSVAVHREFHNKPVVRTDQHLLIQILVNLINNAKQAMVDVPIHDRRITIRVSLHGADRVRVEVADNGCGISEEHQRRIFEHGFTTKPDGHGFGLHTSSISAKQLGGSLTAHSDGPGRGAQFNLDLPVQCPGKQEAAV